MTDEPKALRVHRQHPETGVAAVLYAPGAWARLWPISVRDALLADSMPDQELAAAFAKCCDLQKGPEPTGPQWRDLGASWAALNAQGEGQADDEGEAPRSMGKPADAIGLALALVVRVGHSRADILEVTHEGAPYRGWTMLQLKFWARHGQRVLDREEARGMASHHLAESPFHAAKPADATARLNRRLKELQRG